MKQLPTRSDVFEPSGAARRYGLLGKQLNYKLDTQRQMGIDRTWRREAVRIRRELRNQFGEVVRTRDPQYYTRGHVTIAKPKTVREAATTSVRLTLAPKTGEVEKVYYRAQENPKHKLELPSASSAMALVEGEPGALPRVVAHLLGRALLIGMGIYAAGGGRNTPKLALGGSLAIEAFVLYCAYNQSREY